MKSAFRKQVFGMLFVDIITMAVKRVDYNVIGCCYNISYKIKTRVITNYNIW